MTERARVTLEQLLMYIDETFKATVEEVDEYAIKQREVHGLQRVQWKVLPAGKTKNITELSAKLRAIFEPFITEMIRHGIITHNGTNNISLFYSLAMLLNLSGGDFTALSEEKQLEFISNMKYKLINDIKDGSIIEQYNYEEYGWRKRDLLDAISNFRNDRRVLRLMADYLNINIFLLNIVEDKLIAVYREPHFCEFKASVFLSYFDEVFEPIIYKDKLTMTYNDEPLRKVFKVEHRNVHLVDFEKIPRVFESRPEDLTTSSRDGFIELGTPGQYEEALTNNDIVEEEVTGTEEIFVKNPKKKVNQPIDDAKSAKPTATVVNNVSAAESIDTKAVKSAKPTATVTEKSAKPTAAESIDVKAVKSAKPTATVVNNVSAAESIDTKAVKSAKPTATESIDVKAVKSAKSTSSVVNSVSAAESVKAVKSTKVDYSVLSNVSVKLSLAELQEYAGKFNVPIKTGTKAKTKAMLSEELMNLYASHL